MLVWCRCEQVPAGPNSAHTWSLYSVTPIIPVPELPETNNLPKPVLQRTLTYLSGVLTWPTAPWKWPAMSWFSPTAAATAAVTGGAAELIRAGSVKYSESASHAVSYRGAHAPDTLQQSDNNGSDSAIPAHTNNGLSPSLNAAQPTLSISPSGEIAVGPEMPLQHTSCPQRLSTVSTQGDTTTSDFEIQSQPESEIHSTLPLRSQAASGAASFSQFHRTYVVKPGKVTSHGIEEVTDSPRVVALWNRDLQQGAEHVRQDVPEMPGAAAEQRHGQQQQREVNPIRMIEMEHAEGLRAQQRTGNLNESCYASS